MLDSPQEEVKPKTGRPSDYSPELATLICERITEGESLRAICRDEEMPDKTTVLRWLRVHEEFRTQYAQAREDQAETLLDEIFEIADDTTHDTIHGEFGPRPDTEWIGRSKLRVDARKWAMSKLAPKKYGEKIAVDHTNDGEPFKVYAGFDPAKV
ncbi:hypothetical protein [Hymenobacter koreensis]|uniref:Terminase small subunit protein n=1 Tax=Hymenobacter koreensis TaxID=1084523 RepID=A0ABP8JNA8_9BACT